MIIKRRVTKGFVQIPNDVVRDKRLALDEHGMLHYLLSLPDDWEVNLKQLETYWRIGRDRRRRIFRALRKTGWAQLERLHSDDGAFIGARWIIGDEPGPEASDDVLADDPADDEDGVPGNPADTTAAPESKAPDVLVPGDHETPLTGVGQPDGRVNHAPPKASPLLRKTSEEHVDSTNTTDTSLSTAKSTSTADDDVDEGEPPPRFGELLRQWPADHVVSPFACEKAFAKFTDKQKIAAFHGIKPYLADCRDKGHNRLCDLRTYLDERRFEKFAGRPVGRTMYACRRGTPQAQRWREHYTRNAPEKLKMFEMLLSSSGVVTTESEWPPPIDPLAKTG